MIRLTTQRQQLTPLAPQLRPGPAATPPAAFEERWLSTVATTAGVMFVVLCAVVTLTADRTIVSTPGGDQSPLPLTPAVLEIGNVPG